MDALQHFLLGIRIKLNSGIPWKIALAEDLDYPRRILGWLEVGLDRVARAFNVVAVSLRVVSGAASPELATDVLNLLIAFWGFVFVAGVWSIGCGRRGVWVSWGLDTV